MKENMKEPSVKIFTEAKLAAMTAEMKLSYDEIKTLLTIATEAKDD